MISKGNISVGYDKNKLKSSSNNKSSGGTANGRKKRTVTNSRSSSRSSSRSPQRGRQNRRSPKTIKNETLNSLPTVKVKKGEKPVKVGSLLGLEQVGQCIFIEYDNDIIIVDAGMEFSGTDSTLGADYIIPDISYIKKNINKLKGIFLTHGHLDHIGALRDILPELNFPTIYTTPLTLGLVKKSFDNQHDMKKVKAKIVNPDTEVVNIGAFTVEFARVNHSIPETCALSISTPKGTIFTSGDFKIDYTPDIDKPADLAKISRIGTEGVKLYIGDSLNSWRKGYAPSEKEISKNLAEIIRKAPGRLILAMFASNIGRAIQIIKNSVKQDKIVFLSGRSMVNNIEVCRELGYVDVPKKYLRKLDKSADEMPDHKVVILSTGAQGEEFSALARMSRNEHSQIVLRKGDTILLSSTAIPGNEVQMQIMKNNLVTKDINLITSDDMDVHTSGHGGAEDHKMMLHLLKPQYFLPFYLDAYARHNYKQLAIDMGYDPHHILFPKENGSVIELYDNGIRLSEKKIELNTVLIDGKGQGHLSGEYVIRARKIMAQDGMVTFILKIDTDTKELIGNIQIESRGFVYSSEVRKIHTEVVKFVRKKYISYYKKVRTKFMIKKLKDDLGEHLRKIIGREPMIVPMYVYISRHDPSIHAEDDIVGMTLEEQGEDH